MLSNVAELTGSPRSPHGSRRLLSVGRRCVGVLRVRFHSVVLARKQAPLPALGSPMKRLLHHPLSRRIAENVPSMAMFGFGKVTRSWHVVHSSCAIQSRSLTNWLCSGQIVIDVLEGECEKECDMYGSALSYFCASLGTAV